MQATNSDILLTYALKCKQVAAGHVVSRVPLRLTPWRSWLADNAARYTSTPFAPHHATAWGWFDGLRPGEDAPACVLILPRGGGKSTTVELGTCYAGTTGRRAFVLYVCGTQAKANEHVQSIGGVLEQMGVERALSKYGHSRGWSQSILKTASGFYVVAQGLDAMARGVKIDWFRPDLIVFDDIDEREDSETATAKKIRTITQSIMPAAAPHGVVFFAQNLIHEDSVASRLVDGRADFLLNRLPTKAVPAAYNLQLELEAQSDGTNRYKVTGGEPTWLGQSLTVIEKQINDWGWTAFRREAQHEVAESDDGLWNRERDIDKYRVAKADTANVIIGVDPNATGSGDEVGIIVGSADAARQHGYCLADLSEQTSPGTWARTVVDAYWAYGADLVVAEDNNGGEMVELTIKAVDPRVRVKRVHASRGKRTRAEPVQERAQTGHIHHVGIFTALEKELCRWAPGMPSPNRLDAYVWVMTELLLGSTPKPAQAGPPRQQLQQVRIRR